MIKYFNNKGSMYIRAIVALIIFLMALSAIMQYGTLKSNAKQVKQAMEKASMSVCLDNSYNSFSSQREGYTGAYLKQGNTWTVNVTDGDVYSQLSNILGLEKQGNKYVKINDGKVLYTISDLDVKTTASDFQSDTYTETKFHTDATISIRMELNFMGLSFPVNTKVKSKSTYNYRF